MDEDAEIEDGLRDKEGRDEGDEETGGQGEKLSLCISIIRVLPLRLKSDGQLRPPFKEFWPEDSHPVYGERGIFPVSVGRH